MLTIEVSQVVFDQLKTIQSDSETTNSVIERLLSHYCNATPIIKQDIKPELIFVPNIQMIENECLDSTKVENVEVSITMEGGSRKFIKAPHLKIGKAFKSTLWSSNLKGWKSKKIIKAEYELIKHIDAFNQDINGLEYFVEDIAHFLALKMSEFTLLINRAEYYLNDKNDTMLKFDLKKSMKKQTLQGIKSELFSFDNDSISAQVNISEYYAQPSLYYRDCFDLKTPSNCLILSRILGISVSDMLLIIEDLNVSIVDNDKITFDWNECDSKIAQKIKVLKSEYDLTHEKNFSEQTEIKTVTIFQTDLTRKLDIPSAYKFIY